MKIILYLVAGFFCLAFLPIAAPILLIVAVIHMFENKKKNSQKALIQEALREAGVAPKNNVSHKTGKSNGWKVAVLGIFAIWFVGQYGQGSNKTADIQQPSNVKHVQSPPVVLNTQAAAEVISPQSTSKPVWFFSHENICAAAVATIMGRPINIIKSQYESAGVVLVSYTRTQDRKSFEYRCKLSDDRVIWQARNDGVWGRWRDHPSDPQIRYKVDGASLSVSEDGNSKTYNGSDFRK